jgi:hypothetical protein
MSLPRITGAELLFTRLIVPLDTAQSCGCGQFCKLLLSAGSTATTCLSVKGTGIETDCPGRRVLFSDILHKWLWGCIGSSIAGLVEGTVFAGDLDYIFTEVLLDAVGLEEDSAPNELSVQVWNNHCLEVDIPVVPAKRFVNFPYSWQLSNSIC